MLWHIYVVCFQPNLPWSIDLFPAGCWHWRLAWCFFCICLGLLTVGSSQVQTQKWKQLQLATNHVWNRMLDFFVAGCWERVQSFDWAMHSPWWGWRWRWGLGLLTVGSSQVQTQKWKELKLATITFETECWYFFCGKMLGKNPVFLTGLCFFFCEPDGDGGVWACWRLVPHRSKLQIGKSQCKLATNHVWNRMLDFFSWQEVGKESSLLTGLCIFVWWGWRWDPTDNLHVFFGFLWACWRWVPHRSQSQNWEETIFLKGLSAVLYHEYHTPCAPAQNTHHAYHFQIGSTIKITQTQSPRLQFLDWPTPPRWPFPGSIRSGGGADEED